jgi:choline dehydrogenase-like flavoprotein
MGGWIPFQTLLVSLLGTLLPLLRRLVPEMSLSSRQIPLPFPILTCNGYDDADLERSAIAIRKVRHYAKTLGIIFRDEVAPGHDVKTNEQIKDYVRAFGWGHHAIGTAKMGTNDDNMAVVDGQFKVRGAQSLRVVDSSVLPNHPGFYVMIPLYMLAEKASDDIAKGNVTISPASLGCM